MKKRKLNVIKKIGVMVLAGVMLAGCLTGCGSSNKNNDEKVTKKSDDPQDALDDYFAALNNLDKDELVAVCNPLGKNSTGSFYILITNRMGFSEGIIYEIDYFRMDKELITKYLEGYGFTYDAIGERNDLAMKNELDEAQLERIFPNFKASYELLDMKKASDCTISHKKGDKEVIVEDMESTIEEGFGIDVADGEVYVAKFKIYWEYNGMPYGNDKDLWDYDIVKTKFENTPYETYESTTEYFDNMEYYMVIYKCDGKWYLYTDNIRSFSDSELHWSFEM